jgi:hypothetical protein
MRSVGCLLLVAGLWSLLMWGMLGLLVEPQAQVVMWSLRLGVDPNDTQWFAEWLEETEQGIRLGLMIIWGAGLLLMAVLAVMAIVSARAERKAE